MQVPLFTRVCGAVDVRIPRTRRPHPVGPAHGRDPRGAEGRDRPELGVNIINLGLVYGLRFSERGVLEIDMTLTTAECPLTDVIEEQVASVLRNLVGTYHLNWVWLPPWSAQRITDEGREQLRALGFNI